MDWPRTLPAELPWGERAMAARHVTPAIILSLWAPAHGPSIQPLNDKLRRDEKYGRSANRR